MDKSAPIGIIGAGAWGTALAQTVARAGRPVRLWARDQVQAASIADRRRNLRHLPGITLDPAIEATSDLRDLDACAVLLLAVPAQAVRDVAARLPPSPSTLVLCAKGLERASGQRLSIVVAKARPKVALAALSGPNFALEIASGLPAAATLGCADGTLGRELAGALSSRHFRVYWTDDLIGVEIGGAVKNVLAIAAGMVIGSGLGENARAALISRGLAELARLGEAQGARRETLMGLSGLGDLLLTATSMTSRNFTFGHAVGRRGGTPAASSAGKPLVEGVASAGAVACLADAHGVELPICRAVHDVLEGRRGLADVLDELMRRPLKTEAEA